MIIKVPRSFYIHTEHDRPISFGEDWKVLSEKMKEIDINLQVHYIPVHLQPFYQRNYGFKSGDFPVSENFYHQELSLPIYPDLSNDQISMVVNRLLENISS